MSEELKGKRVAFLATDGVEQVELTKPLDAVRAAGAQAEIISIHPGSIQGFNHLEKADTFEVDGQASDARADAFDALVLPGGVANPDMLRTDGGAVEFVRGFFEQGKPVAAICHGPWMLVEADVLSGRTVTSWPSLKADISNAGGNWVDEECHIDGKLITSRKPEDLPAFCEAIVRELSQAPAP